jgi:GTP cyclohydrolase II
MSSSQAIGGVPVQNGSGPSTKPALAVRVASAAKLPSQFGEFHVYVFANNHDAKEHVALVRGQVFGCQDVPTRVHSECLTGDVLASLRCDCREQLERALAHLGSMPRGVLLYLRQEGRGIGLTNKIRAYDLQERGLDTVDANLALGFQDDERDYGIAAAMLRTLGVRSIQLMTNNPKKVRELEGHGIRISQRLPHAFAPNLHNRTYLETKANRCGHWMNVEGDEPSASLPEALQGAS